MEEVAERLMQGKPVQAMKRAVEGALPPVKVQECGGRDFFLSFIVPVLLQDVMIIRYATLSGVRPHS